MIRLQAKERRYVLKRDAEYSRVGLDVRPDWRYDLIQDFLEISPSYQIVLNDLQGRRFEQYPLPKDHQLVRKVVKDFGDIRKEEGLWWRTIGMKLYGIAAPRPEVQAIGYANEDLSEIKANSGSYQSIVVQVPTAITLSEAVQQFKKAMSGYKFAVGVPESIKPKYVLIRSKLREETLRNCLLAVSGYLTGLQLWEIGNELSLVAAQCISKEELKSLPKDELHYRKNVLSIAARRLIRQAVLVAENAARGRFPTDASFPEAVLTPYSRTAGRPRSDFNRASRRTKSPWNMLGDT